MKMSTLAHNGRQLFVVSSLVGVGAFGCSTYAWKPGPTAVGTYEEASGRCSIVAKSDRTSFYAQGTPAYVAGATMGAAIGEAARQQNGFNDCMRASGWIPGSADKKELEAIRAEAVQLVAEMKACAASVRNSPKYAPLISHFGDPDSGRYSLAQMADSSYVNKADVPLLSSYADEKTKCVESNLDEIAKLDPRAAARYRQAQLAITDLNLALLKRKITWGDYSRQAQEMNDAIATGKPISASPQGGNLSSN